MGGRAQRRGGRPVAPGTSDLVDSGPKVVDVQERHAGNGGVDASIAQRQARSIALYDDGRRRMAGGCKCQRRRPLQADRPVAEILQLSPNPTLARANLQRQARLGR